ncbi:MAG: CPBP family intramembrane glutamic endopeptidase [Sphingopyxis sp.]|nr:CPBP family intramembrane glutamic endopeptidase [Sphingopyxis sp.]
MGVGLWQVGPDTPLGKFASEQFVWGTPLAAAFMLAVALAMGWRDLGFNAARPAGSWRLLWLPMLLVLGFASTLVLLGRPVPGSILLIVAINTFIVGFSEELAFRGVMWGAARKAMPFWGAFILVTFLFGIVHVLNGLMTGQFVEAGVQALNAMMSGAAFLALRIRTHSLIPVIILHWLWDLSVFAVGAGREGPAAASDPLEQLTGGLMIVGPLALYGLYLIRNAKVREGWDDDKINDAIVKH